MSNTKETKAGAKATAAEEATEQEFLARKATEPYQAKKPKAEAADTAATTAEGTIQPREGDPEFLPPPDPPAVESPPFPPPTGYEVSNQQKGAQPEATAAREMELLQVGTRGEGPAPDEPEAPPPEGKAKKGEDQ